MSTVSDTNVFTPVPLPPQLVRARAIFISIAQDPFTQPRRMQVPKFTFLLCILLAATVSAAPGTLLTDPSCGSVSDSGPSKRDGEHICARCTLNPFVKANIELAFPLPPSENCWV